MVFSCDTLTNERIVTKTASGSHRNRPQFEAALDYLKRGRQARRLETLAAGSFPDTGELDRLGHP